MPNLDPRAGALKSVFTSSPQPSSSSPKTPSSSLSVNKVASKPIAGFGSHPPTALRSSTAASVSEQKMISAKRQQPQRESSSQRPQTFIPTAIERNVKQEHESRAGRPDNWDGQVVRDSNVGQGDIYYAQVQRRGQAGKFDMGGTHPKQVVARDRNADAEKQRSQMQGPGFQEGQQQSSDHSPRSGPADHFFAHPHHDQQDDDVEMHQGEEEDSGGPRVQDEESPSKGYHLAHIYHPQNPRSTTEGKARPPHSTHQADYNQESSVHSDHGEAPPQNPYARVPTFKRSDSRTALPQTMAVGPPAWHGHNASHNDAIGDEYGRGDYGEHERDMQQESFMAVDEENYDYNSDQQDPQFASQGPIYHNAPLNPSKLRNAVPIPSESPIQDDQYQDEYGDDHYPSQAYVGQDQHRQRGMPVQGGRHVIQPIEGYGQQEDLHQVPVSPMQPRARQRAGNVGSPQALNRQMGEAFVPPTNKALFDRQLPFKDVFKLMSSINVQKIEAQCKAIAIKNHDLGMDWDYINKLHQDQEAKNNEINAHFEVYKSAMNDIIDNKDRAIEYKIIMTGKYNDAGSVLKSRATGLQDQTKQYGGDKKRKIV